MAGRTAARSLKVNWRPGSPLPPQKDFYDSMRKQPSHDVMLVDSKDVDEKLEVSFPCLESYVFRIHIRPTAPSAPRAR